MPKISRKRKLLCSLIQDCTTSLQLTNVDQWDEALDESLENITEILSTRFINPKTVQPKSTHWYDTIFPVLDEESFQREMRVSPENFNYILSLIRNHEIFTSTTTKQIMIEKQLAIFLWRIGHSGTAASYSQVGRIFGVGSCGSVQSATQRVITALVSLKDQFIYWPAPAERRQLVERIVDFPGCVGFVDGTHVNLEEAPCVINPAEYFSRKQRYGLHLQLICDLDHRIRHMKVGHTASAHDARVFSSCILSKQPEIYFSGGEYLVGDAAYKLSENMITPFKKNSRTGTAKQRQQFNYHLSRQRVKIEQVYGYVKEKFTSLKELRIRIRNAEDHKYACKWIEACCILYNIIRPVDVESHFIQGFEVADDVDYEFPEDDEQGLQRRNQLFSRLLQSM